MSSSVASEEFATRLTSWRRHLHAHPELSTEESGTAAFVCERLAELGIDFTAGIGGHGVVATLSRGGSNRSVGLRADMDALAIEETTGLPHASTRKGVMHACGHDGHTTSLLGAAALLKNDPSWRGTIRLVFQPAEEGFGGANAMLADGLLERFPMERIFGYHNWPGLPVGEVAVHDGALMAAGEHMFIHLKGRAGHAAMPHLTLDPVQGAAHLIIALNAIVARNVHPIDSAVISICTLKGGDATNQIPETVTLGGTYRAHKPAVMALLKTRIAETAENIARTFGLSVEIETSHTVSVTANSPGQADLAAAAAKAAGLPVRRDFPPTMGSEDFGEFLTRIPGAYVWIGNGEAKDGPHGKGLHNPGYDYNDTILPLAAAYLAETAKHALAQT